MAEGRADFKPPRPCAPRAIEEPITLIGDEPQIPYQRPPLSKGFLLGKQEQRHAELRPATFYDTHRITLVTARATAIDRESRRVKLDSGEHIEYDTLVLATGARNRSLAHAGAFYLRTLTEATEIRQRLAAAQDVVVIGGGFIGLEVAAAARTLNKQVTVIEGQSRLMARVVAPVVSEYFRSQHEAKGVDVLLNATLLGIGDREVLLGERTRRPADLVIAGIGVVPNVELARDAGLPVGNGITVDEYLQTPDPAHFRDRRLRRESQYVRGSSVPSGIGAKRRGSGGLRRQGDCRSPDALYIGAVVLDRSVRYPSANGGLADGVRPCGDARQS